MVLTQSLSAGLSLLLIFIFTLLKHWKNKTSVQAFATGLLFVGAVCSLLLWVVPLEHPSLTRRVYLTQAALAMSAKHPLLGVGLQGFSTQVERYAPTKEVVRFVQPVHNTILLVLAETGLLGTLAVLTAVALATPNTKKNLLYAAALTSPILFLDHYFYTLQTGQLTLLFFIFWVTLAGSRQEPSPR